MWHSLFFCMLEFMWPDQQYWGCRRITTKTKNLTDFLEICILNVFSAHLAVGLRETNFHVSSRFSIHPLDALILFYLYKCDGLDFCLFWLCFLLYLPNSVFFSRASAQVFLFSSDPFAVFSSFWQLFPVSSIFCLRASFLPFCAGFLEFLTVNLFVELSL